MYEKLAVGPRKLNIFQGKNLFCNFHFNKRRKKDLFCNEKISSQFKGIDKK